MRSGETDFDIFQELFYRLPQAKGAMDNGEFNSAIYHEDRDINAAKLVVIAFFLTNQSKLWVH